MNTITDDQGNVWVIEPYYTIVKGTDLYFEEVLNGYILKPKEDKEVI